MSGAPVAAAAHGGARRAVWAKRLLGAYLAAEGAGLAHHSYAKRRARNAPLPRRAPADSEYSRRFLSLARCDVHEGTALSSSIPGTKDGGLAPASAVAAPAQINVACARFVRHAFYGTPPEVLPREAVVGWLTQHLGDEVVADEVLPSLEQALGPCAPCAGSTVASDRGVQPVPFVYGEGHLKAWYKPLPLRLMMEVQRLHAKHRLAQDGFVEHRDPNVQGLRYWVRSGDSPGMQKEPPLVILHGYGRGIAGPLFDKLLPALGDSRPCIVVDCSWLLVTRVPKNGDVTKTPSVREVANSVAKFLAGQLGSGEVHASEFDVLAHSFGTALASALARELVAAADEQRQQPIAVRKAILMDPMCFLPGITKQAQLIVRTPRDVVEELVGEAAPGTPGLSWREVISATVLRPPKPGDTLDPPEDQAEAATERRRWVIFQTYFFFYFIFRDLVYSWVNLRSLQGPDYLDRGLFRQLNRRGRLLTVLAETDAMIPAPLLREELSSEAPADSYGGVLWLPTVGHGACQHRQDVVERISAFLSAA